MEAWASPDLIPKRPTGLWILPMGVSSRKVLALRLAPCDANSSATCICNKINSSDRNLCVCAYLSCFLLCSPYLTPARRSMKRLPAIRVSEVHASSPLQQQLCSLHIAIRCRSVQLWGKRKKMDWSEQVLLQVCSTCLGFEVRCCFGVNQIIRLSFTGLCWTYVGLKQCKKKKIRFRSDWWCQSQI